MADERFPEKRTVKLPAGVSSKIDEAASRELTTGAEWMRRALIQQLKADGLDPTTTEAA
jgi:hypothetical protein